MARYPRSAARMTFQKIAHAVAAFGGTVPPEAAAPTVRGMLADPRLAGHERGRADDVSGHYDGLERKYGWDSIARTSYGPFRVVRLKANPQQVLWLTIESGGNSAGEMLYARKEDLDLQMAEEARLPRPLPVVIDARALTLAEVEALYAAMAALEVRDQWVNRWLIHVTLDQALDACRLFIQGRQQKQGPWPFTLLSFERRDLWDAKVSVLLKESLRPQILPEAQRIVGLFEKLRL